jgi:hypothetical protein
MPTTISFAVLRHSDTPVMAHSTGAALALLTCRTFQRELEDLASDTPRLKPGACEEQSEQARI